MVGRDRIPHQTTLIHARMRARARAHTHTHTHTQHTDRSTGSISLPAAFPAAEVPRVSVLHVCACVQCEMHKTLVEHGAGGVVARLSTAARREEALEVTHVGLLKSRAPMFRPCRTMLSTATRSGTREEAERRREAEGECNRWQIASAGLRSRRL